MGRDDGFSTDDLERPRSLDGRVDRGTRNGFLQGDGRDRGVFCGCIDVDVGRGDAGDGRSGEEYVGQLGIRGRYLVAWRTR